LGSINTIYFFLFGYLFRPHIRAPDSIAIFITILILFLYLQLRQVSRGTLITSVALFLAVIITKVIGIELSLLKAVLILITTTLSAVSVF
jgi:predicted branched-subunit amino acid permease